MENRSLHLKRCDPDELLEAIDGTSLQHRVLPGGELSAEVEQLHLDGSVLNRGFYGMNIIADGAMPCGVISVGMVTSKQADALVNGLICPPLSIQLYSEGSELTYRAEPANAWLVYCVERERIQQVALRLHGRPLPIPHRGAVSIELAETDGLRIVATVKALFSLGAYPQPGAAIEALATQLEEQLVYELACAINDRRYPDWSRQAKDVSQRRGLMQSAEDYLRANLSEPFSLNDFAEAAGVSYRTLQRHFRIVYGVTPQVWFRSMKLNAIRRELQQSSGTDERISDIAMRWGFLHLGRFSEEYRHLFGECPRDTLKR